MVVSGPTLRLRYLVPDDAPALFELASDPEVTEWFSWGPYTHESEAREFIERLTRQRETGDRLELGIVRGDDRPIGLTGFSDFSHRDRRATVGTWLGRDHWGSGANRESKALILALGFRHLGLNRVTALAHPDNRRSLRALERIGFWTEGVLRAYHFHRGEPRDTAILRMLRDRFESSELAKVPYELEGEPPPAFVVTPSGTSEPPR
ncbi:MAG: GNAT family N-acetyltransferase [Actinomycetota bacterium]|nr:GNAT family N-acetyltransferase [Actinomycetota bacterium]